MIFLSNILESKKLKLQYTKLSYKWIKMCRKNTDWLYDKRDIVVAGNPKVYVALKKKLEEVLIELKSSNDAQPSQEHLETIKLINKTLYEMKGDKDE